VHGLEATYGDSIEFIYLDIDDPRTNDFKRTLGYRYQPHLFLLDGEGNVVNQWIGRVSAHDLETAFVQALDE
jgi:hypothetical protein